MHMQWQAAIQATACQLQGISVATPHRLLLLKVFLTLGGECSKHHCLFELLSCEQRWGSFTPLPGLTPGLVAGCCVYVCNLDLT